MRQRTTKTPLLPPFPLKSQVMLNQTSIMWNQFTPTDSEVLCPSYTHYGSKKKNLLNSNHCCCAPPNLNSAQENMTPPVPHARKQKAGKKTTSIRLSFWWYRRSELRIPHLKKNKLATIKDTNVPPPLCTSTSNTRKKNILQWQTKDNDVNDLCGRCKWAIKIPQLRKPG